jgi:hypothetical protein
MQTGNELRVKSMQLMGRQNLSLYKDWKGDEAAVQREFERNKEIGLKTGCWKANMLVSDDNGGVCRVCRASGNVATTGSVFRVVLVTQR